ncbi:MAG: hypothetical protein WD651_12510 [Acidimicrobiia bacterium]
MRVLFACVSENGENWHREVTNLVLSVRRFGGKLSKAPFVVNFVETVEPAYSADLEALGAEIRIVDRFDARIPTSNKLRMLQLVDSYEFDVLLALDCDTIVMGDLSEIIGSGVSIQAKPENYDPFGLDAWRLVFRELDIEEPSRPLLTTSGGQMVYPYYNSGVMFVPAALSSVLYHRWSKRIADLIQFKQANPGILPQRKFTDQMALALTGIADGIPISRLPASINFSTTGRIHPLYRGELGPPFVLHYHNEMNNRGLIFRPILAELSPLIDTFNEELATYRGYDFVGTPSPPATRGLFRRLHRIGWYRSSPVKWLRGRQWLAPLRSAIKRISRGT